MDIPMCVVPQNKKKNHRNLYQDKPTDVDRGTGFFCCPRSLFYGSDRLAKLCTWCISADTRY